MHREPDSSSRVWFIFQLKMGHSWFLVSLQLSEEVGCKFSGLLLAQFLSFTVLIIRKMLDGEQLRNECGKKARICLVLVGSLQVALVGWRANNGNGNNQLKMDHSRELGMKEDMNGFLWSLGEGFVEEVKVLSRQDGLGPSSWSCKKKQTCTGSG